MRLLLLLLFIVVPLIELFVIIQVGRIVGAPLTVLALLVISVAGAALVKREGLRAWSRFREALGAAKLPAEEVTDGALVLLAGALLLTPGFVTDAVGLLLLVPPSRAIVNRALRSRVRFSFGLGQARSRGGAGWPAGDSTDPNDDGAVEVEVVDVRRTEPEERDELGRGGTA
jgi:UPF0716 protein FxsA